MSVINLDFVRQVAAWGCNRGLPVQIEEPNLLVQLGMAQIDLRSFCWVFFCFEERGCVEDYK